MPVVQFQRDPHQYRVDGAVVPSITQILDAAGLAPDYARIPPAILLNARLRGEHVDACCDLFDDDDLDWSTVHPEAVPYVRAWGRFRERERYTPIMSQPRLFHPELGYAGSGDSYGLIDKAPTLAERKCTAKIAETYALQTAAQAMPGIGLAVDETGGELLTLTVARRLVVQLRNDGEYRLYDCEVEAKRAGRDDFECFRAAVSLARWKATTNGSGKR